MRSVISDEDFLVIVDRHRVGEVDVGTLKVVFKGSELVVDQSPHHLALQHNDPALLVHSQSPGVHDDVRTETTHKGSVRREDLNLVSWVEWLAQKLFGG